MKLGEIEILPLLDGYIVSPLPSSRPLPDSGSEAWKEQHGMFRPDGMVESTVGGFLVRIADRLVVVDAGSGQDFAGGYTAPDVDPHDLENPIVASMRGRGLTDEAIGAFADDLRRIQVAQGRLLESLRHVGLQPEDVTDLVFTHLHYDHIGWASANGSAVFPNATVRCAAADLTHFLAGPDEEWFVSQVFKAVSAADRLGPVLDHMETWESDATLFPGFDVRLVGGHTPGSSVVVLSSGDQRAMLLGDMVHCPLELTDDDFNFMVDHDPALAIKLREVYARELEGAAIPAAASHFPGLRFGRVLPGSASRRWVFDPSVSEVPAP